MATNETSDLASDSPVTKVLSITELLEQILVGLDFKTLLFATRTNKKFKNVIERNQDLQKKLFLWPVESFEEALSLGFAEENGMLVGLGVGNVPACTNAAFINTRMLELDLEQHQPTNWRKYGLEGLRLRLADIGTAPNGAPADRIR